ncbi:hypothetical protein HELRODRAFT_161108 [Helobdella robusta]|uniref:EF-hand domain-containing protein n=1 Tax=Helobdella robusta TaxID=6412 RepID=T1ER38_HELRO|nr:hypothetical protein HELRODRAFT_161108 [Helobdella robusta]ESO01910.1 hypothetical protein HELRODRAFT_161108 [Helobdella robusta]
MWNGTTHKSTVKNELTKYEKVDLTKYEKAAELYEVHSSARHDHEDLLVRNKYKYLSSKCSNASESSWVEQLRTVFKMTDTDSSGKARLFDLNKNLKSITGDKSKYLGYDLFQGSLARDARKVSFEDVRIIEKFLNTLLQSAAYIPQPFNLPSN